MKQNRITGVMLFSLLVSSFTCSIFMEMIRFPGNETLQDRVNELSQAPRASVVNGYEFYSEQLQFQLAGEHCLVRQSAITEDKFILNKIPLDDIAFKNATLIMLVSNGIYPGNYMDVHVPLNEIVSYQLPVKGFMGYLTYGITDQNKINKRKAAAKNIMQEAFQIELFEQTMDEPGAFSFYGVTPEWQRTLDTFTTQLPDDGYFKYFDPTDFSSETYASNHHLSVGAASIDPYGGDLTDFNITGAFMDILDLLELNASEIEDFIGLNFTDSEIEILEDKMTLTFVQYEGADLGLSKTPMDVYKFDMKTALGLEPTDILKPSNAVWNSLIELDPRGVLTTLVGVNVITGSVQDWTFNAPNLTIDDQFLDTIYLASGLFSDDVEIISTIEALEYVIANVSFSTHWEKTGASTSLYSNVNVSTEAVDDFIDDIAAFIPEGFRDDLSFPDSPLYLIGFTGLPYIPSGLLSPIPNILVDYTISVGENHPNLVAKLQSSDPIKPFQEQIPLSLNITNFGDETAYGIKFVQGYADIDELTGGLISGGHVPYEFRGFSIPSLGGADMFNAYYGIENILINHSNVEDDILRLLLEGFDSSLLGGNEDGYADMAEIGVISSSQPWNYLDPGESIIIDLSDESLSGLYVPFENETANFTSTMLLNGSQVNATVSNQTDAGSIDFDTWDIVTNDTGGVHNITLDFEFQNETGNVAPGDIKALGFTYIGYNNVSIWENGMADFYIYNYSALSWVPINNLTRPDDNATFNQTENQIFSWTDSFTIFDGENDTMNATIDISHYMDGVNNTVRLRLILDNNESTLMSIDYMAMDYLQRNLTNFQIPAQSVTYTDIVGKTIQRCTSNNIRVGSRNSSSLVVSQRASGYKLSPGAGVTITIEIFNGGTVDALGVNLSIPLPGIVTNAGDFTLDGNYLEENIASISSGSTITRQFQIDLPNSLTVPGVSVEYDNETVVNGSRADYSARGNTFYINGPVDYESSGTSPKVIVVETSTELNASMPIPIINQTFLLDVSVAITNAPVGFNSLNLSFPESPNYEYVGSSNLSIALSGGLGDDQQEMNKTSYKGYLAPAAAIGENQMTILMRHVPDDPVQVGEMQLEITKTIQPATLNTLSKTLDRTGTALSSTFTMIRKDLIAVTINITNTGDLPIGISEFLDQDQRHGLIIDDNLGFDQAGFDVVHGKTSLANVTLNATQSVSFTYGLKAIRVGEYDLGRVEHDYYFINKTSVTSDSFEANVKERPEYIAMYLGIALGITGILAISSILNKRKQRKAYEEFKRSDTILYKVIEETEDDYSEYLD